MDDSPGTHEGTELREHIRRYLGEDGATPRRIRNVLLPLCLHYEPVTREEMSRLLRLSQQQTPAPAQHQRQ